MAAIGRYSNTPRISLGRQLGTSAAVNYIRSGVKAGTIPVVNTLTLTGADRLDSLAGAIYGDSSYWWLLAAASNIGWGLQAPPGTVISVVRLADVQAALG